MISLIRITIIISLLMPLISNATPLITISNVKIRPRFQQNWPSTIYLNITNDSDNLDYLMSAEIINQPNSSIAINKTVFEKNIARIIKIDRLTIPSHSSINLKPLGIYMVVNNLSPEEEIKIKFTFKNAGEITLNY